MKPDWSYQEKAISNIKSDLSGSVKSKIGVVIPTGGGKTRIALRAASQFWIDYSLKVLWVTHRTLLEEQAKDRLKSLINDGIIRDKGFEENIEFALVNSLPDDLSLYGLIIIDEAHRAAADSYSIINSLKQRVLYLTATPNRPDYKPIGFDKISYQTTYRDLFDRGVIIEPEFVPLEVDSFDLSQKSEREKIYEFLFSNMKVKFLKTLVLVKKKTIRDKLYEEFSDFIKSQNHIDAEKYVFCLSSGMTDNPSLEFANGVVFSTDSLVKEGYDDKYIDSVMLTFQSTSIINKLQSAGRCLRYAEGKENSYIIQFYNNDIAYYFDNAWLDVDISEYLFPRVLSMTKSSFIDYLKSKNIEMSESVLNSIRGSSLMTLSSLSYYGDKERFELDVKCSLLGFKNENKYVLKKILNDIALDKSKIKDPSRYVERFFNESDRLELSRSLLYDFVLSCNYAFEEIVDKKQFPNRPTRTSNTFVEVIYLSDDLINLEDFLKDVVNKDVIKARFVEHQHELIKLPLIKDTFEGFILKKGALENLMTNLNEVDNFTSFARCIPEELVGLPYSSVDRLNLLTFEMFFNNLVFNKRKLNDRD
ncbi:hypothetical protein BIY24_03750 [Halobacteriovorax marinus]|uniref:DEAD/DEAH box helicase n=1 Tax=Halobacteriovorax marinus TaxID=97084 RepID=UPI000BC2E985|nr:DEAD/DEAH box helicase family protein [Halobacteriovorax marinus]ATH07080.1 hypothetical protein BIY24_03750 [Halobacteriovorax marinus]